MKFRGTVAALLLIALASIPAGAGQNPPPGAQPQQPTFKLRVDYVEVDVVVTDRQGNLVRDLKKDDFQVLEDGKNRAITNFTLVDIPIERYDRPLFTNTPI